ncbi:MAG: ABC transporter ATP-binding protein [Bryobacteraceae bacterium]
MYELRNVGRRFGDVAVLNNISLGFSGANLIALSGPNGAGKSTLLGVMAGLDSRYTGECLFQGREVRKWPRPEFARKVSVVPQSIRIEFAFTAEQIVLMGRTPFADGMFESAEDAAQVEDAMQLTGTWQFRARDFRSLSGGEKQRVILASALAQSPEILLLDEPTTFLDFEHQLGLYDLLRKLCRDGLLALVVTHDLNLASAYADRLVLLREGSLAADGTPQQVIRADVLKDVFHVEAQVRPSPVGRPWIHYGA